MSHLAARSVLPPADGKERFVNAEREWEKENQQQRMPHVSKVALLGARGGIFHLVTPQCCPGHSRLVVKGHTFRKN